ncbi:glycosyltransferase [Microbacterium esteraromaticum]|uniref:glycosyltransferase n=1 Tax=Microbacterium esteraromaticum TaxID=57043 RepID=UPI00195A6FC5|nr:glycosyltransferase [Microbacterium esteraromaticum]MBM7467110.1 glycosyltransferase involved in cell wall biosynthesis [Microbacterium esteraromaticum]
MTRPHLLYTAWSFPPSRAGGVYRAVATVNAFAAAGWDVTVLTVPEQLFRMSTGIDAELAAQVDDSIRVMREDPDVPAFQNDLASWPWLRARHPELFKLVDLRRDFRSFPEPNYGRWRRGLEAMAERAHRLKPVDLAIGTANPHVDFIPGWHLHRTHGVPYVMDYRDAWQLDVFSGRRLVTATPAVRRWERRLIGSAAEVWFVNDAIRSWHAQRYPDFSDRMQVVANGFDEYKESLRVPVRPGREQGLTFGYIGTITPNVPLDLMLEGWSRARATEPELAGAELVLRGYIGHFGSGDATAAKRIEAAAADGVRYDGPVGKADIARTYREFDALVLALGTGRYVTSGKVYEYAATGIPVVSVHDPGNAATDVMAGSPAWVRTETMTADGIAAAFAQAARVARNQDMAAREAAQEWGAKYSRISQLAPRIEALSPGRT